VRTGRTVRGRAAVASFFLAAVASLALLFAPTGTSETACSPSEACHPRVTHPSLLQSQGWGVAVPLSAPVAVAGVAAALRRTRAGRPAAVAAGVLLSGFVLLGALSVGLFYLPCAVAMFVGAGPAVRGAEAPA
jgi:hypothetical protein